MKRITIHNIRQAKAEGRKLTVLTAYDGAMARLIDSAEVDMILVGDSLGMVVQGHQDTISVTLEQMIYHCGIVSRTTARSLVIGDMPFMSYQVSVEDGLRNAGRLMKEGRCHAVKLEGAGRHLPLIEALVESGIPVMGHIGLTPQSVHQLGGFRIQGRDQDGASRLLEEAKQIEAAGAYSLVLEGIPSNVAKTITEAISIPTIGIGAGVSCDGQVLVINDLLGMDESFKPKFVRRYANLASDITNAVRSFVSDVHDGSFPDASESFGERKKAESQLYSSAKPKD